MQPPHNILFSFPALPTYIQSKFSVPSLCDDNVDNTARRQRRRTNAEKDENEGKRRWKEKVGVKSRKKAGKIEEECYNYRARFERDKDSKIEEILD